MKVAIVYNDPIPDKYREMGEGRAELGVLDEVKAVKQAITELHYTSGLYPLRPPLAAASHKLAELQKDRPDVIFNLFEGFDGAPETEAALAKLLGKTGIPFTGSPPAALALALDKSRAKQALNATGIRAPQHQVLSPDTIQSFNLAFPCIIKPLAEDASHGLSEDSVVNTYPELERQVGKISRLFGGHALVEEYLDGREYNTTIMGNEKLTILAVSEIVYSLPEGKPRILTFEAKWAEESVYYRGSQVSCPAQIEETKKRAIAVVARRAFRALGCRGYARVDLREGGKGQLYVLEVNPNPDIGPDSGAAKQAACAGMRYNGFIRRIILLALRAHGSRLTAHSSRLMAKL